MTNRLSILTKTARAKLPVRRDPHWHRIQKGLYLGYRKLDEATGTWIGRRMGDDGRYAYESFGSLPGYDEALKLIQKWADELSQGMSQDDRNLSLADVCRRYVTNRRNRKGIQTAEDAEKRFERLVFNAPIGRIKFVKLSAAHVTEWMDAQVRGEDDDARRRSKDSANRNYKQLRAALNYGRDVLGLPVTANLRTVKAYPDVERRRDGWLTQEQRRALLDAMRPDLRLFATALALTGARPGEMASANLQDFNRSAGMLRLDGKTGERMIPVSSQARAFLDEQVKGKIGPKTPIFTTADGKRWTDSAWGHAFRDARTKARLPKAVLYCFRHSFISQAMSDGISVYDIATLCGTSVSKVESNYGSLPVNITERLDRVAVM
jgi:integrase